MAHGGQEFTLGAAGGLRLFFGLEQLHLRVFAHHELAHLVADAADRLQQLVMGFFNAVAEELDDSEHLPLVQNGKRQRAMQPAGRRLGGPVEKRVRHHIGNPVALLHGPHPARKAYADFAGEVPAHLNKWRVGLRGIAPAFQQMKLAGRRVKHPKIAHAARHAVAHAFKHPRCPVAHRLRPRKTAGDEELQRAPLLIAPALRDVGLDGHEVDQPALGVQDRLRVNGGPVGRGALGVFEHLDLECLSQAHLLAHVFHRVGICF